MFKFLFAILALGSFAQVQAQASEIQITEDTVGLYAVQDPVVTVSPFVCPKGKKCTKEVKTTVKLAYTLSGCLDELAPVAYRVLDGEGSVFVAAYGLKNKRSRSVKCFRAPVGKVEFTMLGSVKAEDIQILPLDSFAPAETN